MEETIKPIGVSKLAGHPKALNFWPSTAERDENAAGIAASVAECGVKNPLLVSPRGDGTYWVIDGCNRLAAARDAGLSEVPCRIRDIGEEAVDDEVFISNMERTRFSSGLRIMRYLERHRDAVIATAEANDDPAARGAHGGRGNKAGVADTGFTAAAIAGRLKVSKKDVIRGIELLRCLAGNLKVKVSGSVRRMVPLEDEEERYDLDASYRRVIGGKTPLRRWVAAKGGRTATEGQGKAQTDYVKVAEEAVTKLCTAFDNWHSVQFKVPERRDAFERKLNRAFGNMPEIFRRVLIEQIPPSWPTPDKQALAKALKVKGW